MFNDNLVCLMTIWYILSWFGIFCRDLVCLWPFGIFVLNWFIFARFGMLYLEKSGKFCHNVHKTIGNFFKLASWPSLLHRELFWSRNSAKKTGAPISSSRHYLRTSKSDQKSLAPEMGNRKSVSMADCRPVWQPDNGGGHQCDQIGRIFAQWAIVYFGQFFGIT
jgi:hypothetical protein